MPDITGSELLEVFSALANPYRVQILAMLYNRTNYVSQLARQIGISRPLLIMHLKKLEDAGLVESKLVLSEDGKAMRYYEVIDFDIRLTPELFASFITNL
jgi:ArsR family transcriptional regulator